VLFLGGQVTYRVKVMNTSPESVTLTSLVDDGFGRPEWAGQLIHFEDVGDAWWHMDVHLHEVVSYGPNTSNANRETATARDDENNATTA
jgi:hypothetical protein